MHQQQGEEGRKLLGSVGGEDALGEQGPGRAADWGARVAQVLGDPGQRWIMCARYGRSAMLVCSIQACVCQMMVVCMSK